MYRGRDLKVEVLIEDEDEDDIERMERKRNNTSGLSASASGFPIIWLLYIPLFEKKLYVEVGYTPS